MGKIAPEIEQILRDLNPWWSPPHRVRPDPPEFRRRRVASIVSALRGPRSLIHVLRGPRQVGKTTALHQIVADLIPSGVPPDTLFLIRFDLQPLREVGLLPLARWHAEQFPKRARRRAVLLLDEVHKLDDWDSQVKHLFDTFPVNLVLTGSSSVLVARGQRESLAGRAVTVEFPPFLFREVLEAWFRPGLDALPPAVPVRELVEGGGAASARRFEEIHRQPAQRMLSWRRKLDRYYNRGGYPRLHSGEVDDDRWADYLVETVFDRVLGVDIPDLFPVDQPRLLRHVYLEVARRTGTEISQSALAQACNSAGFRTSQPVIGRYLHYLADTLLIREFRRYPLGRSRTSRLPSKMTLTDLGVRNAIFRGAPSLWESAPTVVGPLVETLTQTVLTGPGLQVHFFRDFTVPGDRRSKLEEVDFVVETIDGTVLPIEVKFRARIDAEDANAVRRFIDRFKSPFGIVVTRDHFEWDHRARVLFVPILDFLLAF
jgi:hypothetical protein